MLTYQHMLIKKGPDALRLVAALFFLNEYEDARPSVNFQVEWQGKKGTLTVSNVGVLPIDLLRYRISGIGELCLREGGLGEYVFQNAPVQISYSIHARDGVAEVKLS